MQSFKKLDTASAAKSQNKKIERELPFFITIVTLLATSGLGPYIILQKIRDIQLLPAVREEATKILKRIDMLGIDPLMALDQAKDRPSSKALGEFLSGYVSAIQSGGNVMNYLKSKMYSTFERFENAERSTVEKLSGLVHAYLTMQIVILAVFILVASIGSTPIEGYLANPQAANSNPPYVILIFPPVMSVMFIFIAKKMVHSNIPEMKVKKIVPFATIPVLAFLAIIASGIFPHSVINAYILGVCLVAGSIIPALRFKKVYARNLDAETAVPQILRDITEARKAGIGPEKCIIHTCKRSDYKSFTPIANAVANKLEWGIPINNIYDTIKTELNNFQVLVSFRILFEVIFSGGGNVNTLDTLADTSEKIFNIEKGKRDGLKPYIMVGFMVITITGFTTLLTIDSFSAIEGGNKIGGQTPGQTVETQTFMEMISIAVLAQAWLAGFFFGKITQGAFSSGFYYSVLFVIITMICIMIIQLHIVNIGGMLKSNPMSST